MSRCVMHSFDPATNRCRRCSRWAPGHAPKKAPAANRAECQVCENVQATTKNGRLVHHGYKRPGWGCIVGDCYGAGHAPFPAHDRLEAWLVTVENARGLALEEIAGAPTRKTISRVETDYDAPRPAYGHERPKKTVVYERLELLPRPEVLDYRSPEFGAYYERKKLVERFEEVLAAFVRQQGRIVEETTTEAARIRARITKAKAALAAAEGK